MSDEASGPSVDKDKEKDSQQGEALSGVHGGDKDPSQGGAAVNAINSSWAVETESGSDEGREDDQKEDDESKGDIEPPKTPPKRHSSLEPVTLLTPPRHLDEHPADELHAPDSPTTELITSLRTQLHLLSEQSLQLNTKLVASISRHADLEDQHFALQQTHKQLEQTAEVLRKDKAQWEESMQTGLLVERSQIKDEMQRLAAGLVEEERRRGSAEERRQQVENEVDDLAATLFDQANTMVAQERLGRVQAESRLKTAEENLAAAEAAVRDMQLHLQSMPTTAALTATTPAAEAQAARRKYLSSHLPWTEYALFLQHLRSLRPLKETSKNVFPPPLIANLLQQPFLSRAVVEDHEPTLRLDAAPEISWLSRKGVNQAIIAGDLIIEPVSAATVISASNSVMSDIGCSLCGKPVFPYAAAAATSGPADGPHSPLVSQFGAPPQHPSISTRSSSSRFSLKPFFATSSPGPSVPAPAAPSPSHSPLASPLPGNAHAGSSAPSGPVHVFRIASKPNATQGTENRQYPLCKTGWCLERLRATCELWRFIRTGIIQVVWHGDDGFILASEREGGLVPPGAAGLSTPGPPSSSRGSLATLSETPITVSSPATSLATPVPEPPRRKSGWGLGFKLDKSGSGWGKAFGGNGGRGSIASPPVSPHLQREGSLGAEKEDDPVPDRVPVIGGGGGGAAAGKLGAPLELTERVSMDTANAAAEVAALNEMMISPKSQDNEVGATIPVPLAVPTPTDESATGETDTATEGDAAGDSGPEAFTTPNEERDEPALGAAEGNEAKTDTPAPVDAEQSAPDTTGKSKSETETKPEADAEPRNSRPVSLVGGAAPPPVPRRAAARNRLSKVDGTAGGTASHPESGAATPVERKSLDGGAALPSTPPPAAAADGEQTDMQAVSLNDTPKLDSSAAAADEKRLSIVSTSSASAAQKRLSVPGPPLPPRHASGAAAGHEPTTPIGNSNNNNNNNGGHTRSGSLAAGAVPAGSQAVDGEKAFMRSAVISGEAAGATAASSAVPAEDSWEGKTWKEVVRLKEEMWRARIGVVDLKPGEEDD